MNIKILASESLGVRSFCTYVETKDVRIIIDPGCALGPDRFSLPPHKLEVECLWECWQKINEYLEKSDIAIITHYHYDHHHYRNAYLYKGKIVLTKDLSNINPMQRLRAEKFFKELTNPKSILIGDGKKFQFGETEIQFTGALSHGYGRKDVKVIGVFIRDDSESLFYTSDISGVIEDSLFDFLKTKEIPTLIFDGFPLYLKGPVLRNKWFIDSLKRLKYLIDACKIRNLIIDHHSSRTTDWKKYYEDVINHKGLSFAGTAAEFHGIEPNYLESVRKILYSKQ